MRAIKAKDTTPELLVRKNLFKRGFRYRLHKQGLPGKPDIVLPKYKLVIFVNGCFWHGHDCSLFKLPKTNTAFWKEKINKTKERDHNSYYLLRKHGWKVFVIWECVTKTTNVLDAKIEKLSMSIKSM
jgi:DNA mismatch endonuclease (patch repair protein)